MKQVIFSDKAPKALGPYSHACATDALVYSAGQIGLDPATGELAPGGIAAETRQALTNIKAVLEASGTTMDNVLKTLVFLTDMGNFGEMNKVYAEFFSEGRYPARSAIQVGPMPKGALVEIEVIAAK